MRICANLFSRLSLCSFLTVCTSFATVSTQAQQRLTFRHLTVEEGLSQNTVNDILQDSLGMLWVGTQNGLNRYNGYEFETFEAISHDSLTLSSSFINCMAPGRDQTIWIGTKRGLCLWDQKLGVFLRMNRFFAEDDLKGQYEIGDILLDSDGGVWVMGESKGFHIFHKKKDEEYFNKVLALNNPPGNNVGFYGQIMEDSAGNIWIGTSRFGLWIFNKRNKSLAHVELNLNGNPPVTSVVEHNGEIWVGTLGGLFVSKNYGQSFEKIEAVENTIIRCLYRDPKNRLWIGTDNRGLLLYHPTENTFTTFDHSLADAGSLLHNSVLRVYLDQQNILWVGTYAGGLNYYNPLASAFRVYQSGTGTNYLSDNSVTSFAEDPSGRVWVATDRGGLNSFDPKKKTFDHFRADKRSPSSISSDIIQHISTSSDGNLWIGHWATGLDYFDRKSLRVHNFAHQPGHTGSLSSNSINFIFEDTDQNLLLATDAGLNVLDSRQRMQLKSLAPIFRVYKNDPSDPATLSDTYIKTIFQDRQKRIWIGSWVGLNLWNTETSTFYNFKNNPEGLKLFTNDYVLCIAQGHAANMLVGTNENGLLYYISESDSLIYFNKQNGFPSNTILGMQQDDKGLWWLSTTNGLVRFSENDFSHTHYTRQDGLPSNEFRQNASARLKDGQMLFGTNNGFAIFHPDSVKINNAPPKVSIIQFKISNTAVRPGDGILSKDISVTQKIELSHHQSSISFQFIAINFTAPGKNSYAYKLDGIDKDWNYVGSQRTANFSYIPPGEYRFSVKAANNDGVWSEPVELLVIVTPPWWTRIWFKMVVAFAVASGLLAAYKLRTRQLKRTKKQLERLVQERTFELKEKNDLLTQRQDEIVQQKEQLTVQRDHLRQQFDTIQTLSEIGQKITASLKKEELIVQLFGVLDKLMDVNELSIGHLDEAQGQIEFSSIRGLKSQIHESIVTLNEDRFSVRCIEQGKVIRVNDLRKEYAIHFSSDHNGYMDGEQVSAMYLPLFSTEGLITGVLVVKSCQLNAYTDVHVNTLKNLAAYIGIAFENVNIYKALVAQSEVLTRQSEKLEELDKLKTRFFVNISHEFRTPLTLIITPLEQMLSDGAARDPKEMNRQLQVMHKNAKSLLHLINQLLEIRNLESTGTRKIMAAELDLVAFSRSVLNRFEELSRQLEIELTFHSEKEKLPVWFDPDMIQKVLSNLYSNAFKYTTSGGRIQTILTVRSSEAIDHAVIQIQDTGIGITQSELPFVFERFYQGDAPVNPIQQSSGIGLSLIKDLLDLHNGRIEVESEKGTGTCFTICLPLGVGTPRNTAGEDLPQIAEETDSQMNNSQGSDHVDGHELKTDLPRLLIVEDNEDVRELLRIEFQSEFQVIEARDGREGIDLCLKSVPDLVLSDIMMPVLDGIALCDFIKTDERTNHIPIILLTAKTGEHSQIKGLTTGADDYVSKPFNVKILRARIHNLIETRRKLHVLFSSKEKLKVKEVIENTQDRAFIEKVDAQIARHLKNTELNHETLGREIGMSKTQLYRKLQSITGKSVHEYIRNYRLRIAHELLMEKPDILVSEVAYEVGFKDPSYFSKCFFAFYNVWPKELKKGSPVP